MLRNPSETPQRFFLAESRLDGRLVHRSDGRHQRAIYHRAYSQVLQLFFRVPKCDPVLCRALSKAGYQQEFSGYLLEDPYSGSRSKPIRESILTEKHSDGQRSRLMLLTTLQFNELSTSQKSSA